MLARHQQAVDCRKHIARRFRIAADQVVAIFLKHAFAAAETHARAGIERAIEDDAFGQPRLDRRRGLGDRAAAIDAAELGLAVIGQARQAERVEDRRFADVVPGIADEAVDLVEVDTGILDGGGDSLDRELQLAAPGIGRELGLADSCYAGCHSLSPIGGGQRFARKGSIMPLRTVGD